MVDRAQKVYRDDSPVFYLKFVDVSIWLKNYIGLFLFHLCCHPSFTEGQGDFLVFAVHMEIMMGLGCLAILEL